MRHVPSEPPINPPDDETGACPCCTDGIVLRQNWQGQMERKDCPVCCGTGEITLTQARKLRDDHWQDTHGWY